MKNKGLVFKIAVLAFGTLLLALGACSIIGLAIGASVNKKYTIERPVPVYKLDSLRKGTHLSVFRGGKTIEGGFAEIRTNDTSGARILAIERNVPNSSVQIKIDIPFVEIDSVLVAEKYAVSKGQQWSNGWQIVHLPRKTRLEVHKKDGSIVEGKFIKAIKTDPTDKAPNQIKLRKSIGDSLCTIPVADISYVVCTGASNYALKGFLIGLGVDLTVVTIAVGTALSGNWLHFEYTGSASANSCPYVYSSADGRYQFEGEMFVGSFFKGAQRTDILPLHHLRAADGKCRLRLTNELDETEYIDHVSLLAVEHPLGTRIVPTGEGQIWALGNTLLPHKATDLAGLDATEDLHQRDGRGWLSNPFGRNPDDPKDQRDGLVLEFDRPDGADTALLALRLMNTPWTVNLQTQLQVLPGRDQEAWYAHMDQSPEARQALFTAMARELMLRISVWDGSEWRPCGYVWEVGAAAERDVAFALPLNGVPSYTNLKIRLDCPPGTWVVDFAELDYHARREYADNISATRATDGAGQDISAVISAADGWYYDMPRLYQYADIEFVVPNYKPGGAYSFLVQCSGYYSTRVHAEGEPQTELMNRLLQQQGALNQYALECINRDAAKWKSAKPQ